MNRLALGAWILVVLLGLGWALWFWEPSAGGAANGGASASDPRGGDFRLQSASGPVGLEDFRGQVVVLYFGYTFCPDICPTSLALLSLALFGALALDSRARFLPRSAVSQTLPSAVSVQIAASNVRFGGEEVFRRMAEKWPRGEPPYVVDTRGQELFGRAVDLEVTDIYLRVMRRLSRPPPQRIRPARPA